MPLFAISIDAGAHLNRPNWLPFIPPLTDLIQISSSWGSRNGGPLGRNRYVEVTPPKNGNPSKATPIHKRCAHLGKGIIVEGGSRGQILTICAEPSCTVHHAQTQQSRQAKRRRASLNRLPYEYAQSLAIRHKLIASEKNSVSTNHSRLLGDHLKGLDETGLSRFLVEVSLLEAVTNTYSNTAVEPLEAAAKRYRVNTEKIAESVAAEFAAKQKKRDQRNKASRPHKSKTAQTAKRKS